MSARVVQLRLGVRPARTECRSVARIVPVVFVEWVGKRRCRPTATRACYFCDSIDRFVDVKTVSKWFLYSCSC